MFWFPAPATPDPTAATFLEVERQWITGPLTLSRLVLTALIPVWFIALAAALRERLWAAAALVIVAGTALKVGVELLHGRGERVDHRAAGRVGECSGCGRADLRLLADTASVRAFASRITTLEIELTFRRLG